MGERVEKPRDEKEEALNEREIAVSEGANRKRKREETKKKCREERGRRVKEPERETDRRWERRTGKLMAEDNKSETKGNDR